MSNSDYIAIAGVFATVLGILVTWLIMKRQFASKKLTYSYTVERLLNKSDPDLARDLKVLYQGDELPEPTLMSFKIVNTGLTAVEDAEIIVQLPGTTYLIPGYFVDVPVGYSTLWTIDRTDAEECTLRFKHINPKQVATVHLLMDEMPKGEPYISCPMPNVELTKASTVRLGFVAGLVAQGIAPHLYGSIRQR